TCAGRVVFGKLHGRTAEPLDFVADIVLELALRPLCQLLIHFTALVGAVSDVAHVPDCQLAHALLPGKVGQALAAGVEDVALLAIELGRGLRLAPLQPLPPSASLPTAGKFGTQAAMTLVAKPLDRAQMPPVHDERSA